jgi:Pentapeptide repeats (8 copies)
MATEDKSQPPPPSSKLENPSKESTSIPAGDNLRASLLSDKDPNEKGFFNRLRRGGKTIWDWLNLLGVLAVPIFVVLATIGFGWLQIQLANQQHDSGQRIANQQHVVDQQNALEQQRATILQTYLDNIQDLLLNHNLRNSKPDDEVAVLARARTLTALQGLDSDRKGRLAQFLYDAQLIGFAEYAEDGKLKLRHNPIIGLSNANLKGAHLRGVDLRRADLRDARLNDAYLIVADLTVADLRGANLRGADLTQQQLDQVYCKDAILPQGLTCNRT